VADFNTQFSMMEIRPELSVTYFSNRAQDILSAPNRMELEILWIEEAPEYRQSPDFKNLMTELGLPAYWDLYGWPDMCRPTSANEFECD
ncbi:MAG: hypothetical protein OEU53_07440, partial [Gammaproteobacteria bacterium]|nr:hypothetical protein [Gammaproteobacteria bacterium]